MRIKSNYILQKIVDEFLLVPVGEEAERVRGVVRLNEEGAFLWTCISEGIEESGLEEKLINKYKINKSVAHNDVTQFITQLTDIGCIEQ